MNSLPSFLGASLFMFAGILHFIGGFLRYAAAIAFTKKLLANRMMPSGQYEVLAIAQLTVGVILIMLSVYVWNW